MALNSGVETWAATPRALSLPPWRALHRGSSSSEFRGVCLNRVQPVRSRKNSSNSSSSRVGYSMNCWMELTSMMSPGMPAQRMFLGLSSSNMGPSPA